MTVEATPLSKTTPIIAILSVIIIGILLYWPALVDLTERWEKQEEYSHGFLIPFVAGYFVWQKQAHLQSLSFQSSWYGFVLILISLLLYIIGKVSILYILIDYSLVLLIVGFIWTAIGTQALKSIIIPLMMLVFAIPLPYFIDALLSSELQLLSSRLGVEFIILCKIPVFLEGNVIDLGDFKLQVVEACSGLRYLFPLMSIGFICAYMFDTALWKRALVFVSSIPITIMMNSFRIGLVGLLVNRWGIEAAEGFLHDFEGWVVFMASLVLLIIEMIILARLGSNPKPLSEVFGVEEHYQHEQQPESLLLKYKFSLPFYSSLTLLVLIGGILFSLEHREEIIPERKTFTQFPLQIDNWQGKRDVLDKPTLDLLQLTDYAYVNYQKKSAATVNFYVAYYESQRNSVVPHSPRVCIPGGGWEIADISRQVFNGFPLNRLLIKKGLTQNLVYYWYQQRGQVLANEYKMKWSLFTDALSLNRTDGALVRLTTSVYPDESLEDADNRLQGFLANVSPLLSDYIPN